jgi:regulator of protease activity HflC (stomatin/prohibitin superfamily)
MDEITTILRCFVTPAFVGMLVFFFAGLRVVQEYERSIVFRLGWFSRVAGPGLYWIIPLFEWQKKVDIRTNTVSVERQETITKDSVTVKINAVLWYRIVNPSKAIISVADYRNAVQQVALTSLRNIIGQHMLDEVLKDRNSINRTLRTIVDTATEPWGIKVEIVEMKDVEIPESMQRAMAREAEAICEKRARLIKAEAELEASEKLSLGAKQIAENPVALELRRMQMISEVGAEQNSTTIILMPSDFVTLAKDISQKLVPVKNISTPPIQKGEIGGPTTK